MRAISLRKCYSEIYLITARFRVPSQEVRGTLTTMHFERHPTHENFAGMDQDTC